MSRAAALSPVPRTIAIGGDHGGYALKGALIPLLQSRGIVVADLGTHSPEPCDYPLIGRKVAEAVASRQFERGIVICKSGIGIAMAANKVPGIRAALVHDARSAALSRQHNDANVLVLGAEAISMATAKRLVGIWLTTPFESGGRHERRVKQIAAIERSYATPTRRGSRNR